LAARVNSCLAAQQELEVGRRRVEARAVDLLHEVLPDRVLVRGVDHLPQQAADHRAHLISVPSAVEPKKPMFLSCPAACRR
jgi:hypothetical protein